MLYDLSRSCVSSTVQPVQALRKILFNLTFQELALKLRAEGKTYKPQKSPKSSTKAESALSAHKHGAFPQTQPRQQQLQSVPQRPETGTRPEGPIQVPS